MRKLTLFIVFLLFVSCNSLQENRNVPKSKVTIMTTFRSFGKFKAYHMRILTKELSNDTIKFTYKTPEEHIGDYKSFDNLIILPKQDSIILYNKITCRLRGFKDYYLNGDKYRIKKYFYDDDSDDGQADFLVNDSLGLVYINSVVWPNFMTFSAGLTTFLLNQQLIKDTSIFIRNKKNKYQYAEKLEEFINENKKSN